MPKVLLLEEDATYAAEIRRGLARLGFEVVLLRDGSVGLARAVSEKFDLLLISAELPSMNGFRLCNRVKKDPNFGDVPLFLMGNVEHELRMHRELPTRADDYFKKPVVFAELLARIRLRGLHDGADDVTDVSDAKVSLASVAEMQSKLLEQETAIAVLNRDLASARAAGTKLETQAKEIDRLRAETQRSRSIRPPAVGPSHETLQENHAAAIAKLEKSLAAEKATADAARVKLAAAEAEKTTLGARTRDQERTIAQQKKQLEAHTADAERAHTRIEDLSLQIVRSKPTMERLREEVVTAKSLVAADQAAARAFAAERESWTSARVALEADLAKAKTEMSAAVAAKSSAHAAAVSRAEALEAELAKLRAGDPGRDARIAELERELADAEKRGAETEQKRRETTEALSKLSHRTSGVAEERTRLTERIAKTEAHVLRIEQALVTAQQATEREKAARDTAERKRDEAIAEAANQAADKVQEVKATLSRANEQRIGALIAERDARLTAERRRREEAVEAWEAERKALQRHVEDERAAVARTKTEAEQTLAREREARKAIEERLATAEAAADAEHERLDQAATSELGRANARHAKEVEEIERRYAQAVAAESAKVEELLARERSELATTRERHEATLASARAELEKARDEAERLAAQVQALELRQTDDAAVRAEAAVGLEKRLAEERSAMTKMHLRVVTDVRADLELARTATEKAEEHARGLQSALDRELEARQALTVTIDEVVKLDALAREEMARLRATVEQRQARIAELEARLARAPEDPAALGEALAQAKVRIKDLEDTQFETEALRSFESVARATEYEATINALREKLAAAEAARNATTSQAEAGRRVELAEVEASWESRVAAAVEAAKKEASKRHESELDTLLERFVNAEHERAQIQASFEQMLRDLEATMAQTRAQLEAEREAHGATRAASVRNEESLHAEIESRNDVIDALEHETDQVRAEVPELEAEIVVLRSELLTLRRELDAHRVGARAAGAELARHVDVLARAEKILDGGPEDPDA